jgi:hypothetical protein|tara:strand:- start:935 stop:1915 length:981 start_codon:yes stop_codon:yes gene_type:complete
MKNDNPVKLKYTKVIKPRQRNIYVDVFGKLHPEPVREESVEYREYRDTRTNIKGVITPRKIQMYRWWFRYLQLSLELEELEYTLTENRRIKGTKKKKGFDKEYRHKVVVNRKKYEGWDLDEVLTSTFDKWWKGHSHLFVETPTHTTEILKPEDMVLGDHYRYFRVDTRMGTNRSIRTLRQQLETHRRSSKWTSQWTPIGEIRQEKLLNVYNTMVMWLQGKSTKEILTSGLFRTSRGKEIKYEVDKSGGGHNLKYHRKSKFEKNKRTGEIIRKGFDDEGKYFQERGSKSNLDKMRKELLEPGRRLILTVCDGYFSKHPRGKQYFGRK